MSRQFIYIFIFFIFILLHSGCSSDSSESAKTPTSQEDQQTDDSLDKNSTSTTPDDTSSTTDNNNSMYFVVTVPSNTPQDEFVCIGFDDGDTPKLMQRQSADTWEITLPITTATPYRYCRNCECQAADEYFATTQKGWRALSIVPGGSVSDTVTKWRWWSDDLLALDINNSGYIETKPATLPRSNFMTGVMFNDYWNNEWNLSIVTTMQHLKSETNASWIEYAPVNDITQYYPTPIIAFNGANGTSQAQLEAIIDAAHAEGLKVFLNPIPWGLNVTDNTPNDHNSSWWQAFHDEWQPIMMQYTAIAETKGVEMIAFKMWPNIDELNENERPDMDDLAVGLLHAVDGNYSGKIAIQSICYDPDKPNLAVYSDAAADYLMMNIWSYYPWPLAQDPNDENAPADSDANVTTLKDFFGIHLNTGSYGSIEDFSIAHNNKPIIFSQLAPSAYDGAIVAPANNDELLNPFYLNDDSQYIMDLQEQADVTEAILSQITSRNFIQGAFIFNYFYWNSIDKDINIRGKPAEKVVKKWYEWINQ